MKNLYLTPFLTVTSIVLLTACSSQKQASGFQQKLEQHIAEAQAALETLVSDINLQAAIINTAEQHSTFTDTDITEHDSAWKKDPNYELITQLRNSKVSRKLLSFQQEHPLLIEIFVTDDRGLITGLTNPTSDYLQSDEDWWIQAYAEGKGKTYHGAIEYDASADANSVPLYRPVFDASGNIIGVLKAVLDVNAL